ncbi:MmgE/PrpD family protein [Paraburkholderia sp. MMS20-SJTR3]|uniref:MmgE/PrpD family protein n=1 Tax=Paraburkholderia sejongensis TaxID=2886946 RepID=A0ABS8K651_9BURK|nr:MmgE/PrpD family protein [Paraburkholderia sp. MMS20-SJTR3]MCC8397455.1 MmgE/PrpD family protein [Paraburkholderia sp. MMS20-SJTR3]
MNDHPSLTLATFAAQLDFDSIPTEVVERTVNLYVDWLGSALAGKGARPVETIARFARLAGAANGNGPSEVLIDRTRTTPYFAAMINGAASHFAEQDDVHNGSVFHPATVVFPVALALAQARRASGREFIAAAVAGYEVGIRIGEFLGRSHYKVFHTTGTVGTVAAAATAGRLLGLSPAQMLDAFGSAGTQASGLWEFLRAAADSKQLHTAMAAANGLMAAQLAADGFKGATHILEGAQGMAAGMSSDADPARLTDRLGSRWATAETSFKYHAACRHTHPAADALLSVVQTHRLAPREIAKVVAHVHQGAIDVLGPVVTPRTVHQAKFNMGTVLGLVAHHGYAGVTEFEQGFDASEIAAFRDKVTMALDAEVDGAYPARWIGKVTVTTNDGRVFAGRVDEPKGDPGNTLSRDEIATKLHRLAAFSGAASEAEAAQLLGTAWQVAGQPQLGSVFGASAKAAVAA